MSSMSWSSVPALFAVTLAGCGGGAAGQSVLPADEPALVRIAPVVDTVLARPIVATGTVAPEDEISLGFKIGGVIARVAVHSGDGVRGGQTLAALDLREIDAGVAKARSAAEKAARDLARARRLYADSVVTLAQLQDAETGDEVARADLRAARVDRRYAVIVAPADGVILRRLAESGENIAAGAPVLILGSREAGAVMKVGLADRDVVAIRKGDPAAVRFDALGGRTVRGRVKRIGAAADPATGTWEVQIALPEFEPLAAGLVGQVEIRPGGGAPATLVPVEAVLEGDGVSATLFAVDGVRARRRTVAVAFIAGDQVAVTHGLEGVRQVVTDGAGYLDDGSAVRVAP